MDTLWNDAGRSVGKIRLPTVSKELIDVVSLWLLESLLRIAPHIHPLAFHEFPLPKGLTPSARSPTHVTRLLPHQTLEDSPRSFLNTAAIAAATVPRDLVGGDTFESQYVV